MTNESHSPLSRSTFSVLSATAAAALALSACAPEEDFPEDEDAAQTEESPSPNSEENDDVQDEDATDDAGATDDDHSTYRAIQTTLDEYPDGIITEFEDSSHDGGHVKVHVYDGSTEWDLKVDSESFEIVHTEDHGIHHDDEEKAQGVEIDIAEALETAEEESGGQPHEGELDTEDGIVVWDFEMDNDVEVYVDVATGEVVKVDE
ncbi:PepSY domain-containing protein [Nesterenkonia natronophila]|nr:PepSY domain-containing protein [Nesterenkonia natronophila]